MSVYIETSLGDIVIDLFVDECPKACKNFLKLCRIKYFHNCMFHNVQRGFIVQTGDPTNTGKGGSSIYGMLFGEQARLFEDEIHPHLRHTKKGLVAMASGKPDQNASQFYFTTGTDLHGLDDKHTIFGEVAEGMYVLEAIDRAIVDDDGRPLKNIRIRRTEIFEDPFEDPPGMDSLLRDSPEPQFEFGDRLEEDWQPTNDNRTAEEIEAEIEKQKAANRKVLLEMIGDRPEADAKPPEDMIFVCKLNPVTTEEDLETIFSRFGTITACDIVRDKKTGDSLNYAFIGFDSKEAAEEAYLKMNNALVDDRRIKVDFSQSMFHLWKQFRRVGKQGDASMKQMADDHGSGGLTGRRILDGGRFELTTGNQHGYGTGKYAFVHDREGEADAGRSKHSGKRRRSPNQDELVDASNKASTREQAHGEHKTDETEKRRRSSHDEKRERRSDREHGSREPALRNDSRRRHERSHDDSVRAEGSHGSRHHHSGDKGRERRDGERLSLRDSEGHDGRHSSRHHDGRHHRDRRHHDKRGESDRDGSFRRAGDRDERRAGSPRDRRR